MPVPTGALCLWTWDSICARQVDNSHTDPLESGGRSLKEPTHKQRKDPFQPFSSMASVRDRQTGTSMSDKTRSQMEVEISEAIIKFEKEYMGRGPDETKTFIIDDMVLVRLRGVLTPAEKQLAKTEDPLKGRVLIKQVRIELLETARVLLETIIRDVLRTKVKTMHTDISTVTGERVIIFTLEQTPCTG